MTTSETTMRQVDSEKHDESSPDEFDKKHPLQRSWTLWFNRPEPRQPDKKVATEHLKSLREVYTFGTVEDFWSVFNHIVNASDLRPGTTYRLMHEDINPPEWEHPMCANGGELKFAVRTDPRTGMTDWQKKKIDEWWLNICLACIGEAFDFSDHICGCNVEVRRNEFRITMWLSTADEQITSHMNTQFRQILELSDDIVSFYNSFKEMLAAYAKWTPK